MRIRDDRTAEQKQTLSLLVVMTDKFLSGWGEATGGKSYAAWACTDEQVEAVEAWVRKRCDASRVRVVIANGYHPKGKGHLHIYVPTVREHFGRLQVGLNL